MAEPFLTTEALVLREVRYKEADRILTLLTPKYGKITAKASNTLRKNSKTAAGTQMLTYSEMVLFSNRGRFLIREAAAKEEFRGLREDFAAYALGCYFSECVETLSEENAPDAELLQLILNSLYALSRQLYDPVVIKAAFEMRLMRLSGYEPDVRSCAVCGRELPDDPFLGTASGQIFCRACRPALSGAAAPLSAEGLRALRHILYAPPKSFIPASMTDRATGALGRASEEFFLTHAGKHFTTLDYWKENT